MTYIFPHDYFDVNILFRSIFSFLWRVCGPFILVHFQWNVKNRYTVIVKLCFQKPVQYDTFNIYIVGIKNISYATTVIHYNRFLLNYSSRVFRLNNFYNTLFHWHACGLLDINLLNTFNFLNDLIFVVLKKISA